MGGREGGSQNGRGGASGEGSEKLGLTSHFAHKTLEGPEATTGL